MAVTTTDGADTARLAGLCRAQADLCAQLGSPFYAGLLRRCAEDAEAGGPVWTVLRDFAGGPEDAYPALRLLGSVHRLVLTGRVPALAAHYPSVGGQPGTGVWDAFRDVVADHAEELALMVREAPQTNEVGRSAALLGGFLDVARRFGLPLRLLEIGASGGLNLVWDRFRYESGDWAWGDPESPVRFRDVFAGGAVPPPTPAEVVERRGCDLRPVDVRDDPGRLTLLSYVWPDQVERTARLRAAVEVAAAAKPPLQLERAPAHEWLAEALAQPRPGVATVVVHSIVLSYFGDTQRRDFATLLAEAGRRSSPEAPLAVLSLERSAGRFEVRLQTWPGGKERLLAEVGGHGLPVRWLDGQEIERRLG